MYNLQFPSYLSMAQDSNLNQRFSYSNYVRVAKCAIDQHLAHTTHMRASLVEINLEPTIRKAPASTVCNLASYPDWPQHVMRVSKDWQLKLAVLYETYTLTLLNKNRRPLQRNVRVVVIDWEEIAHHPQTL